MKKNRQNLFFYIRLLPLYGVIGAIIITFKDYYLKNANFSSAILVGPILSVIISFLLSILFKNIADYNYNYFSNKKLNLVYIMLLIFLLSMHTYKAFLS